MPADIPARSVLPGVCRRTTLAVAAFIAGAAAASAQSPANLLLVVNTTSAASVQIGEYYAAVRAVPRDQMLGIHTPAAEEISRAIYERDVEAPIARWLDRHGAHDRILYIVLVKGVPLRITGTAGRNGTAGSVDSELTLLYRKMTGRVVPPAGPVPNPYFLGERPIRQAERFTHRAFDIFLVSRLDGFSVADIVGLIDRGNRPTQTGRIALDGTPAPDGSAPNRWLRRSADVLREHGHGERVILDEAAAAIAEQSDLLGYFSSGSNDPAITARRTSLSFAPGALAGAFVSSDARTFTAPPEGWTLGRWSDFSTYYAGSPQSLTGDLIRDGVTGAAGQVTEPYLDAAIRPDVLFPAYLSGFNLVEAFYLAIPSLSWQTVVIGDPLCAPFAAAPLPGPDIDGGLDADTELPAFFSARGLAVLSRGAPSTEAWRSLLRAAAREGRGDLDGARVALEQATALDPRLVEAHQRLGVLLDRAGTHAAAIERYRRVIALAPDHVVALNNLAYGLAIHMGMLDDALVHAQRAYAVAPGAVAIVDTLAWIRHLIGDRSEAQRLIAAAMQGDAGNADLALHGALINAAAGSYDTAARLLQQAVTLDATIGQKTEGEQLALLLGGVPAR